MIRRFEIVGLAGLPAVGPHPVVGKQYPLDALFYQRPEAPPKAGPYYGHGSKQNKLPGMVNQAAQLDLGWVVVYQLSLVAQTSKRGNLQQNHMPITSQNNVMSYQSRGQKRSTYSL